MTKKRLELEVVGTVHTSVLTRKHNLYKIGFIIVQKNIKDRLYGKIVYPFSMQKTINDTG